MPETVVHFQIRMPPDIHERLASWAKADKDSLNQLVVRVLKKAIEHREGLAGLLAVARRTSMAEPTPALFPHRHGDLGSPSVSPVSPGVEAPHLD